MPNIKKMSVDYFNHELCQTDCNFHMQLHYEAWVRFVVLSIIAVCVYAFYGQYNANPASDDSIYYHRAPEVEAQ